MFIEIMEVLLDALLDTLKVFPFLFIAFLLIAVLEHHVNSKKLARVLGGKFAPLVGSLTGVVPQCGFSVMGAKLFHEGCITFGTLIAIFISTSDEAIIVLITAGLWKELLILLAVKIVAAVGVGYLVDALMKSRAGLHSHAHDEGEVEYAHCHHAGEGESKFHMFFIHPLLHCLQTAAFVLAVNAALGLIIYFVGESNFETFMANTGYFQPFVSALVGLIPNCAPSVVIAQAYVEHGMSFGGLLAGLIANAGVGLAVLFRQKHGVKRNLFVMFLLYFVGVTAGEIAVIVSLIV